jgi:SAM-dependent methyltransferase
VVRFGASSRHWDEVAAAWPQDRAALWRRHSDAVNAKLIERWLPAPVGRILKTDLFDEVAGPGLFPILRRWADEVVGVDISPRIVDAARRRYPELEAEVAAVGELPFPSASFDAVLSNSTLDHLATKQEVAAALAELGRVTRGRGRLLVTLDNPLNPMIAVRNGLPPQVGRALRRVPYDSGWTCGPRLLRRMLSESGFRPSQTTAIMHAPRFVVAELDRVAPRRRGGERLIARLLAAERLERWPTRYLTGHFVAALGIRV